MSDCRCPQCWGLAEYMAGLTGNDYGLEPAPGHNPLDDPCDGSYTCMCGRCRMLLQQQRIAAEARRLAA